MRMMNQTLNYTGHGISYICGPVVSSLCVKVSVSYGILRETSKSKVVIMQKFEFIFNNPIIKTVEVND